ncbi:MAG: AAA family ATPase [Candidatus Absconditabacterales bacterium]
MFVGNQENIKTLTKYIDMFFADDPKAPHFLIIAGPQHIGKTTIINDLLREKMGNYFITDTLQIKDFSEQLEKKHNLKLKTVLTSEIFKTLIKDHNYQDTGIRDINMRMQQSAIGKHKIVFLENIERMIPEAANAFLKTCEEPLPKRLIIATTSNFTQLIDTILSRALVIKFNELSDDELSQRLESKNMFNDNKELKQLVINMAMGKPGIAQRIYELIKDEPELEKTFTSLIHNLTTNTKRFFAHDALKKLYKYGILEAFIDGRIGYCINNNMQEKGQRRLETKKLMKTNVNIENLLLYGLLND